MLYPHVVTGPSRFIYLKNRQTPDPVSGVNDSESGSVLIHDACSKDAPAESPAGDPAKNTISHQDGKSAPRNTFGHNDNVNNLGMYTQVDSNWASSPKSRKRSARAASLPDSIPPDDEPIGNRRKLMMTEVGLQSHPLLDAPVKNADFSSIPLPVSRPTGVKDDFGSTEFSKGYSQARASLSLPSNFSQAFGSTFKGFGSTERSPAANAEEGTADSLPDYETPVLSPETSPSKYKSTVDANRLTQENLSMQDRDNLSESLRACNGSLVDSADSYKEEDLPLSFEMQIDNHEPKLVLEDGIVYFRTPSNIYPMEYHICVTFEVILRKGKSTDWWELDVRGLPQLASSESGYLYFRTNPGQGMEYCTSPFKRNTVVENCLMAQFTAGKNLVIPFRKCSAKDYGFINDYKITSRIHCRVFETPSGLNFDYLAICSINLINHNFWSERCSFRLYLHGGPEGKYIGPFVEKPPSTQTSTAACVTLPLDSNGTVGVSRLELTCSAAALKLFSLHWTVVAPREKDMVVPYITETENIEAETNLENQFMRVDPMKSILTRGPTLSLRILRITWTLITSLFHTVCFMAFLYALYLSYLQFGHDCTESTSPICRKEPPTSHASSYPRANAADIITYTSPVQEEVTLAKIDEHEIEHTDTQDNHTISLRDRIDYFLGWKGPVVRE